MVAAPGASYRHRQTPAVRMCSLHAPLPRLRAGPRQSEPMRNMTVPVVPATTSEAEPVATLPSEEPQTEAEYDTDSSMWAIVLAGGIGSRFSPLRTPEPPKQMPHLIGE